MITTELLERRWLLASVGADIHDQQRFYLDDLESGTSAWTVDNKGPDRTAGTADDGLWHLTTRRGADAGHSGTRSFYYGQETSGNYDTGGRSGGALLSAPITLPGVAGNEKIHVAFKYFLDSPAVDSFNVPTQLTQSSFGVVVGELSDPLGSNVPIHPGLVSPSGGFLEASADLTKYAGQTVRLRFFMQTTAAAQSREGWYVDDVSINRTRASMWVVDRTVIAQIDADTGATIRQFPVPPDELPPENGAFAAGLAYDGTNLYYHAPSVTSTFFGLVTKNSDILVLDADTGNTVRRIPAYTGSGLIDGLAVNTTNNCLYAIGLSLFGNNTDHLIRVDLSNDQYTVTPFVGPKG